MPELHPTPSDLGVRLDVFVTAHLDLSRSQIQRLIKAGSITLDDKKVTPHTPIESGSVVFYPEAEVVMSAKKTGTAPLLEVVYEDKDVMVIDKPAGIIVHQATPHDTDPTVVDALLELHPEIIHVGDDPARPGIVHRLDKDVSGLMVIAKTQEAFEDLKKQFQSRTVQKEYLALAYGELPLDHDTIDLKIIRSKVRGRMVARPESQEGKESLTEYDVLERLKTTTYVRVRIHTGRTHQIRVHFFALGHSLVGDKLYKMKKMKWRPIDIDRIFLHATKLAFHLPSGEEKMFESTLPKELEQVLSAVR
ncbi:RluA family pseudouridine synthase [Candidatus Uhrbacteria bacterium CG_4_9_14_3_um_filter_50_9]|uniref:Pseudouridine synthase n=1 Tax=Candidatus Uhrbacteria bacterium CG_4_9_14_3_um_filter_50_9 TaxID=1975035 RepID=A0A2M7XBL9_9BACT|nr:MAG: RluA family pseudouridine synthase [Candidatus Uhrbacteria bacterium CG_4_9_14_3_um_filter_50_9]